jgi:hypothetical protein
MGLSNPAFSTRAEILGCVDGIELAMTPIVSRNRRASVDPVSLATPQKCREG